MENTQAITPRTLRTIALEIRADWKKVYFGAVPYLDALLTLGHVPATRADVLKANYICDDARSIVNYFLANATTWKGETARRVKKELKGLAEYR